MTAYMLLFHGDSWWVRRNPWANSVTYITTVWWVRRYSDIKICYRRHIILVRGQKSNETALQMQKKEGWCWAYIMLTVQGLFTAIKVKVNLFMLRCEYIILPSLAEWNCWLNCGSAHYVSIAAWWSKEAWNWEARRNSSVHCQQREANPDLK